jgi:hypothetical protein
VVNCPMFKLCAVLTLKNISDRFSWRLVVVYGLVYDELKLEFISELYFVMEAGQVPPL